MENVIIANSNTLYAEGKFTEADYKALVKAIFDGTVKISNDIVNAPVVGDKVNVEYLGNLK